MISAYLLHLLILIGIYSILALSLQLAMGYTGLINLGHIAFFGIGAYTSALLGIQGVPFVLSILLAGITSALFGYLISIPTNKLKGDYLALATMGFSFLTYALLLNWTELTNGPLGLSGIPNINILGYQFTNNLEYSVLITIIAVISYLIINRICTSPFGKVLQAVRDDDLGAQTLGKNTSTIKSKSLAVSAFFAAISGGIYAHYISFIDPTSFHFIQIIPVLSIVVVGGLGSLKGTLIATVILVLLPEPLRFIGLPITIVGPTRQILYALLLLLIILYKPRGIDGKVNFI